MIGLDRKNREDSIEQLNKTGYLVKNKGISIAISPEGTRSTSGHLNEFKKGPFHLAKASNVPIIPITLYGQFELWPPGQVLPSPGSVSLHFLPAVVDYDQLSYKELLIKIRGIMLEASLDAPIHPPSQFVSTKFWVFHALSMIATYWAFLKFVPLLYNSTSIVYLTAYLMGCYVVSTK
uniref:Phospholipid/glycerol acyltransferase domain-containing protein n=1 Tax=Arcella intermedia TaxID=1963864 RepID=A0A6B2LL31_9EUKA